jgi:Fe-S-cluster containining protein
LKGTKQKQGALFSGINSFDVKLDYRSTPAQKGSTMAAERTEFGVARTECACNTCVANCRFVPGALIPADLDRISEHLNQPDLVQFAFENLLASPGAIICAQDELITIPTLVPARGADGACRFLKEGRCSIHAVSPFNCAFFGHEQTREEADALSMRGLVEIAKAWQRGDLYAQLWIMLHEAGRIAPSPLVARARMRAALDAG